MIHAELIQLVSEHMALKFEIPLEEPVELSLSVMIAIDKSKSMTGSPLADAKGALLSLIQKLKRANVPLTVYLFSNQLVELPSEDLGYDALTERVSGLEAKGGTKFMPVIRAMYERIKLRNYSNVSCIWLSDGQDNQGLESLIPSMDKFRQYMAEREVSISVHTIGFSNYHDAALLNRLSQSGTRPGSFQFVPPNGRIPVAVNNVFNLVFTPPVWADFVSELVSYKINVEGVKAVVYVHEEDLEDAQIEVHAARSMKKYVLEPQRSENFEFKELVFHVTNFISAKILRVLEIEGVNAGVVLKDMEELVKEMQRRLADLIEESKRFKVLYRKQCMAYFQAANELVEAFYDIVKGQPLSNVELAHLNGLAHKVNLKKNLEKKIQEENEENLNIINDSENRILGSIPTQSNVEFFKECIISGKSALDAVLSGDCLCLTFEVERPQNLLGSPFDIKIKTINPGFVSFDAFVESQLFETKAGQMIQGSRSYIHGIKPPKFNDNGIINGLLPLYLSEDHWNVGKLRLMPIIGWDISVDVLSFTKDQVINFPFLVLVKSLEEASTEHQFMLTKLLIDICRAVYFDNREFMKDYLNRIVENYVEFPISRLDVPHNCVFLAQLYCAYVAGDLGKVEHIFPLIFEEEFRRKLVMKKDFDFHKFCIKLFDIDVQQLEKQVSESIYEVPPLKIGESALKFVARVDKYFEHGGLLRPLAKSMELFGGYLISSIESLGLVNTEQKIALVLQSCLHKRNSEREKAIANSTFCNVFQPEECEAYMNSVYKLHVEREILVLKANYIAMMQGDEMLYRAFMFSSSTDLEEAAGNLCGIKEGSEEFPIFIKNLMRPTTELPTHKLAMLCRGEFQGVKLVLSKRENYRWIPNNDNLHKIWLANKEKASKEQWQEVLPEKAEYFDRKYLRLNGEFVPYSKPRINVRDHRHWIGKVDRRL